MNFEMINIKERLPDNGHQRQMLVLFSDGRFGVTYPGYLHHDIELGVEIPTHWCDINPALRAESLDVTGQLQAVRADDYDESPYWLLRSLAEFVVERHPECDRNGDVECYQSSDCITEWCPQCAAKAFLVDAKIKEKSKS